MSNESADANHSVLDQGPLGPQRDSLYIVIPMTVIYLVIFLSGVVGNVVTCIVIARNKHMHTATNYYLFSLAVSDLLLLVSGLPQEMYYHWSRHPYIFGEVFCVLRGLAAEMSANATVLTITAFTVERYVAICHPFLSHTMSKPSRAVKYIVCIWLIALAFAVPQALQFGVLAQNGTDVCTLKEVIIGHSFEISTFLFFVAPMSLISVLYVLIGLRLRRSNMLKKGRGSFKVKDVRVKRDSTSSFGDRKKRLGLSKASDLRLESASLNERSNSCRHYASPASRRVLKMLVAVVVAFFICWAPFHAQRLVAIYGSTTDSNKEHTTFTVLLYSVVTYVSGILYYLSTSINPLLYHIMSYKFRQAFKTTLGSCCGCESLKIREDTYSAGSKRATATTSEGGNLTNRHGVRLLSLRQSRATFGDTKITLQNSV